jgi:hypothetical protein
MPKCGKFGAASTAGWGAGEWLELQFSVEAFKTCRWMEVWPVTTL